MRITHAKLNDVLLEPLTMIGNVVLVGTHLVRRHRFDLRMLLVGHDPEGRAVGRRTASESCQKGPHGASMPTLTRWGAWCRSAAWRQGCWVQCCRTSREVCGECVGGVRLALHVYGMARDVTLDLRGGKHWDGAALETELPTGILVDFPKVFLKLVPLGEEEPHLRPWRNAFHAAHLGDAAHVADVVLEHLAEVAHLGAPVLSMLVVGPLAEDILGLEAVCHMPFHLLELERRVGDALVNDVVYVCDSPRVQMELVDLQAIHAAKHALAGLVVWERYRDTDGRAGFDDEARHVLTASRLMPRERAHLLDDRLRCRIRWKSQDFYVLLSLAQTLAMHDGLLETHSLGLSATDPSRRHATNVICSTAPSRNLVI